MRTRHVRGVLFLDYVRMARRYRLADARGHLLSADREYLERRIEIDAWYPMDSFERLGVAILEEIVGRERASVRLWGHAQVTTILRFVPELLARGDPKESVARLGAFLATLFDFRAIELESTAERSATIRIDYGMQPLAEEAACWQTQGFFEALVQESGGRGLSAQLTHAPGALHHPTVLTLEWAVSTPIPLAAPTIVLPRVLLVDDEPLVLSALERVMRRWARVTSVPSAATALDRLSRESFEVVISDFDLGESDGLTLLRAVADKWPTMARILHTASPPDDVARALVDGVVHAVAEKPVEPTELRRVIGEAQRLASEGNAGA